MNTYASTPGAPTPRLAGSRTSPLGIALFIALLVAGLSSGVAGTMAADRSGLQMATVRNLALAWVLTLPAAIVLSGCLYWLFSHLF